MHRSLLSLTFFVVLLARGSLGRPSEEDETLLEAENEVELRRLPGEDTLKGAESIHQQQPIENQHQTFAVQVNHGDKGASRIYESHGHHQQQQQQVAEPYQAPVQAPAQHGPQPDLNVIRPIAYVKLRDAQVDPHQHAELTQYAKEAAQTYGGPLPVPAPHEPQQMDYQQFQQLRAQYPNLQAPIQGSQLIVQRQPDYSGFKPIISSAPAPAPALVQQPQQQPLQPGYAGNHEGDNGNLAQTDYQQAAPIVGKIVLNASPNDLPNAGHILDYASGAPYHGNFNFKPYSQDYTTGVNINKGRVLPNPAPGEEYKGEGVHSHDTMNFNPHQQKEIQAYEDEIRSQTAPANLDLDAALNQPAQAFSSDLGAYGNGGGYQQQQQQQQPIHFPGPVGNSYGQPQPQYFAPPVSQAPVNTFPANVYGGPSSAGFALPQLGYGPGPVSAPLANGGGGGGFFGFGRPHSNAGGGGGGFGRFFGGFGGALRTRFRPFGGNLYHGLNMAGDKLLSMSSFTRPFRFFSPSSPAAIGPLRPPPSFLAPPPPPFRGSYNANYGYKAAASNAIPSVLKAPFKSMVHAIKARRIANGFKVSAGSA